MIEGYQFTHLLPLNKPVFTWSCIRYCNNGNKSGMAVMGEKVGTPPTDYDIKVLPALLTFVVHLTSYQLSLQPQIGYAPIIYVRVSNMCIAGFLHMYQVYV